jgi:murein DD-endopeptidase MepM/ murein hydrolase activator NlpD
MSLTSQPKRSWTPLIVVVALVGLVLGGVALWAGRRTGGVPTIEITAPEAVGPRGDVVVVVAEPVRGVVDVTVVVEGPGVAARTVAEAHEAPPSSAFAAAGTPRVELKAAIGAQALAGLGAGSLTIRVTATRVGTWLSKPEPVVVDKKVEVRLTPPSVTPQSSFVHVSQGGAEVVVYDVGPTSTFDGVVVARAEGDPWVFPGAPLPGGPATRHFAFFSRPYDDDSAEDVVQQRVQLFAEDALGNRATAGGVVHKALPRPMGKDTIELKEPFLQKVTNEIYAATPSLQKKGNSLDDYLQLNRDLRKQNNAFLVELAKKSQPKFLWSKVFVPFDNAAIKGAFADRRTYVHDGNNVDTQDHLGFDLARVERAPVGAGNDGVIAFAGYLGIYGNCVVIDHGYGLMTLYAHLSSIDIKEGDVVVRGAPIGKTGATGLAGGDHLHFTTLVHGHPTNPIEWWDAHWIGDRIKLKLGDAFAFDAADAGASKPARGKRRHR